MLASNSNYLTTLPSFLGFFAGALVLLAVFFVIYLLVTPHREMRLIRAGNVAAAVSLSGAILGFVIPLAGVIVNSVNLVDAAVWGCVALVIQVLAFVAARLLLPGLVAQIEAGQLAPAILVGTLSLAVGVLNAACVTY